jgi:hypothetical protein
MMGKRHKSQGGGSSNTDRNNGKAKKQNPKSPDAGKTGRSIGGYNIKKRPDKASSWNPILKRKARKAKRMLLGLAYQHGLRTGQLSKIKVSADG